jgi:hypothetical protein
MTVLPATPEAKAVGVQVWGQPKQHSEIPSQKKKGEKIILELKLKNNKGR